jgi:hypothetical protein
MNKENKKINEIEKKIAIKLKKLQDLKKGCLFYPFLGAEIRDSVVDNVFQDLRLKFKV